MTPKHLCFLLVPHRQALDCELSGDFNGALKMYRELVRRYDSAEMDDDEGADAAKGGSWPHPPPGLTGAERVMLSLLKEGIL